MITQAPRGTKDWFGKDMDQRTYLENIFKDLCASYNIHEIITPVFEHTELFQRGVGETTDIVTKETYDFVDRGGRNNTLRPEGTAGVARSIIENKLYEKAYGEALKKAGKILGQTDLNLEKPLMITDNSVGELTSVYDYFDNYNYFYEDSEGDKVNVYYSPGHPEKAEINNPWVNFFKWGFIGIMGVIFIAVGLLISMPSSKKTRRKRKSRP